MIVFVEHFLNEKGVVYFPDWIREIQRVLEKYDGFQSIQQLKDIQNDQRCLLLLHFENLELLRNWAKSDDHDQMIAKLAQYRFQKQASQILEVI